MEKLLTDGNAMEQLFKDAKVSRQALRSIPDFTKLSALELLDCFSTVHTGHRRLAAELLGDRWSSLNSEEKAAFLRVSNNYKFVPLENMVMLHEAFLAALIASDGKDQQLIDHLLGSLRSPYVAQRRVGVLASEWLLLNKDATAIDRKAICAALIRSGIDELRNPFSEVANAASPEPHEDPQIRQVVIHALGCLLSREPEMVLGELLTFAKPSLTNGPTIQSPRGPKQIPVREAYDREFERFLVRMFLERHPDIVVKFLDSEAAAKLPVEARVLASLALEPKASASRVAKLLPQLDRAPNDEELLRLAQFPAEAGVGEALQALLTNEKSRTAVAEKLLAQRTKLDAAQIAPLLTETARAMLRSADAPIRSQSLALIGGFQLAALEGDLVLLLKNDQSGRGVRAPVLNTLRDLRSAESDLFASLAESDPDPLTRDAALEALVASRSPDAATRLLALYPSLQPAQRRTALNTISSTQAGAKTIVTALLDKSLPQTDLDGPTVERLATVLGDDPALTKLQQQLGGIFREVLLLDGQNTAWVDSKITLDGPFTVEAWVRLAPGIGNEDSLLGTANGIQLNFFQSKFRVYAGPELHDVCVATKPMTPDLWTHLAVTRDAQGIIRIYQNGELDATGAKPAPQKWEDCKIGWSGPAKGTEGVMTEFRVWKTARSAQEIRGTFDRTLGVPASAGKTSSADSPIGDLVMTFPPKGGTPSGKGTRLAKTIDTPPLLTEEQAKALDTKFAKFTALAPKGNAANGKLLSALCIACHQIGSEGGQIGPNLSGAGAMGLEAVLRNILTPNAAMEPGYRIYRLEMKNGDLIDAFFVSEDKDATVIRQPGLPDRRLNKTDIRSTKFIRRSLMPEGLLDALPDQGVADLLAYLMTLKG
ncbi:MAG TPA: hypothetical protein DDZ88_31195 [Verrucomicrobiales bacterium]|nr:hypothetical protein [Verrucomicrobiales bacterium]